MKPLTLPQQGLALPFTLVVMLKTSTFILAMQLLAAPLTMAQSRPLPCGFDRANQHLFSQQPALMGRLNQWRQAALSRLQHTRQASGEAGKEDIVIPLFFHIVYKNDDEKIGRDRILRQIRLLNDAFNGLDPHYAANTPYQFRAVADTARISFCLGKYYNSQGKLVDAIKYVPTQVPYFSVANNKLKDSSQGGSSAVLPAEYLNIWVADTDDVAGYATFPGGHQGLDGVVLKYEVVGNSQHPTRYGGKTIVHEVGHYLFLLHPWGWVGHCGTDFIDDTPPAEKQEFGSMDTLHNFPHKQGVCSDHPMGELWASYMTYYDDNSRTMFTRHQVRTMRSMLVPGAPRETLLYSQACQTPSKLQAHCCPAINEIYLKAQARRMLHIAWPASPASQPAYEVRHRAVWEPHWQSQQITTNEFKLSGALTGQAYLFQVRTICANGNFGLWKSFSASLPVPPRCKPPHEKDVQLTITNGSVTVQWPAVAEAELIWAVLNKYPDKPGQPKQPVADARQNTNKLVFSGLRSNTGYEIEISWVCGGLRSFPFKKSFTTAPCLPPEGPLQFTVTGNTVFAQPQAMPAIEYQYLEGYYRQLGQSDYAEVIPGTTSGVLFPELIPATLYEFAVRTRCSGGGYSDAIHGQVTTSINPVIISPLNTNGAGHLALYPNPATQLQTITVGWAATAGTPHRYTSLALLNSQGIVLKVVALQPANEAQVTLGRLPVGIYTVMLQSRLKTISRRLVITR